MRRLHPFAASCILACFVLLSYVLQSCGMSGQASQSRRPQPTEAEIQRQLRSEHGDAFDQAGAQIASLVLKEIAPSSGKELQHAINLYPIRYSEDLTRVACAVEVTFLARDFWSGVGYGTCRLNGWITLDVPGYRGRPYRVTFTVSDYNEQLKKVSNKSKLEWLESKPSFDLRLR